MNRLLGILQQPGVREGVGCTPRPTSAARAVSAAILTPHDPHPSNDSRSSSVMPIRIVRLGTARHPEEGLRIGTVRRPPRGVPKEAFASQDWYDVWFPNLAPSTETMKLGQSATTPAQWATFIRKYRAEMNEASSRHDLALLAALSHNTNVSVGCYCEDEKHCHRSVLRELLVERGAEVAPAGDGEP